MPFQVHTISGIRKQAAAFVTLMTCGEVVYDGLRIELSGVRRFVLKAAGAQLAITYPGTLRVADPGRISVELKHPKIAKELCLPLWELLFNRYAKFGDMLGIRAKQVRPVLSFEDASDYVQVTSMTAELELDYPGVLDPDVSEVRLYPDRAVVAKTGLDCEVRFED